MKDGWFLFKHSIVKDIMKLGVTLSIDCMTRIIFTSSKGELALYDTKVYTSNPNCSPNYRIYSNGSDIFSCHTIDESLKFIKDFHSKSK